MNNIFITTYEFIFPFSYEWKVERSYCSRPESTLKGTTSLLLARRSGFHYRVECSQLLTKSYPQSTKLLTGHLHRSHPCKSKDITQQAGVHNTLRIKINSYMIIWLININLLV